MKSAERELRDILDRRDRKIKRYMKVLTEGFEPNSDGGITFTTETFKALDNLRGRYLTIRRRIAEVKGGGRAQQELLRAFQQFDRSVADFAAAARIGYSMEQVEALDRAAKNINRSVAKVTKIRRGLAG